METGVEIRDASRADLDGLCQVARVTWRATYADVLPYEDIDAFLDRYYHPDELEALAKRFSQTFLVAVDGGEVVGYATTGLNEHGLPTLFAFYVLPDRQGEGIGSALWFEVINRFHEAGFDAFNLWVHEGNTPARQYYERRGAIRGEVTEFPVGSRMAREVAYRVPIA